MNLLFSFTGDFSTIDEGLARRFEPRAPSPARRLQALRKLKENGIATYAFISPYLPHLSHIEQLMQALDGSIDEVGIEALNTRELYWQGVKGVLARYYPERLIGYKQLCREDGYWDNLEQRARLLASQQNIPFMGVYRH